MESISEGLKQLEYYLSDWNIRKDKYLQKTLEESGNGWIDVAFFLQFPRFAEMASGEDLGLLLKEVTTASSTLEADLNRKKVRRKRQYRQVDRQTVDKRTVYVEGFYKPYNTADSIKSLFGDISKDIIFVNPYYDLSTNYFYGFAFVEFGSEESATDFVECFGLASSSRERGLDLELIKSESKPKHEIIRKLLEIKLKLPALRTWSKIEWERLKKEYIAYKEMMQRESLRPLGIKDGAIIKIHGLDQGSSLARVLELASIKTEPLYLEYFPGNISAHVVYENAEDAEVVNKHYNDTKFYDNISDDQCNNKDSVFDKDQLQITSQEKSRPYIRTKILRGKEETNYWEYLWEDPENLYYKSTFNELSWK